MSDYLYLRNSTEPYVDMSGWFEDFYPWTVLSLPKDSGKTTLLSLVQAVYDDSYIMTEKERESITDIEMLARAHEGDIPLHGLPTIQLKLSDFEAKSFNSALQLLGSMLRKLYFSHAARLLGSVGVCRHYCVHTVEDYLKIMEGVFTEKKLACGLKNLINLYYWKYETGLEPYKPMVLIDDANALLDTAKRHGYAPRMRRFLESFIGFPYHYFTGITIITEDYIESNRLGIGYMLDGCSYYYRHKEDFFAKVLRRNQEREHEVKVMSTEDRNQLVVQSGRWIAEWRRERRRYHQHWDRMSKKEYKKEADYNIGVPSRHFNCRSYTLPNVCVEERLQEMNRLLRKLYDPWGKDPSYMTIYDKMQGLKREQYGHERRTLTKALFEMKQDYNDKRTVSIDGNDPYWLYYSAERTKIGKRVSDINKIKLYLSPRGGKESMVFEEVIKSLMDNSTDDFNAKIARQRRCDPICIWVSKKDMYIVQDVADRYKGYLKKPLNFIAYLGMLGISREFSGWYSHNASQARMIDAYFRTIDKKSGIDIVEMYKMFVRGWNRDLPKRHPMTRVFLEENAQMLLIHLETLDCILQNKDVDEMGLLLSDDGMMWSSLARGNNWAQVVSAWESERSNT